MSLLLSLVILFAAEAPAPTTPPQLNDSRFVNLAIKLYGNGDLRTAHQGYWTALQAHPDWLQHEAVWWQLMRTPDLGPLLIRTDELLQREPESQKIYDGFYSALVANPALETAVARFERAALDSHQDPRTWQSAINLFRSDPAGALQYLGGIAPNAELPDVLKPFATQLMNGRNWADMREPLSEIAGSPAAQQALAPWWKQAAALDAQYDGLFSKLSLYLLQHPNRFWALYHRELALAADPHLREWVRWWHRTLRRVVLRYSDYLTYMEAIRTGQEAAPGPSAKPWPPQGPPPALGEIAQEKLPALDAVPVARPELPEVPHPKRPAAAPPRKPVAPEMRQSDLMKKRAREESLPKLSGSAR